MAKKIRIVILDRYQLVIDGYAFRLQNNHSLEIIGSYLNEYDLENHTRDLSYEVLICGVDVPISSDNHNSYSILSFLDNLAVIKPNVKVLVSSYINIPNLVHSLLRKGIYGFLLKDDQKSIENLGKIIEVVHGGGMFFSQGSQHDISDPDWFKLLTTRQFEILMLCASQPDEDTHCLAKVLGISDSTLRNILSQVYKKLNVRSKTAAIIKARQIGLIPPDPKADGNLKTWRF